MATRIAVATGNFTAAGTWLTVDATSLSDSEANNTALTTSYVNSSAFTPGAITVDGVAIKIASRASGTPSNTITLRLGNAGADVAGTVTTMNVSDIPTCDTTNKEGGWVYFRFNVAGTPTPVLLLAATAYTVGVKLSATTTAVNLFRTSTLGNWSRMLATTTTGAPVASDILHIMGDNLAAGTKNSYTVTMDNTASTTFGVAASTTGCLTVSKGGTLTWGISASTAYLLKVAGTIYIYSGGTWDQGTSGTRMPSTSSGALQFVITTNVDGGMWVKAGATFNAYGTAKASNWTYMTADKAIAATVIAVTSTSGWVAGDTLCFASTSQTYTQAETKVILTVDSSTQVTLTAGLTNAHSGTSPTQAEVGNLTRNVSIFGTSTSLQGYVRFDTTAVINIDSVEFYWLGSSTTNKRGINLGTTTGTCNLTSCSFHDFSMADSSVTATSTAFSNTTLTTCVFWSIKEGGLTIAVVTSGSWTITGCLFVGGVLSSGSIVVNLGDIGGTFTNNNITSGDAAGLKLNEEDAAIGTISGNVAHSNGANGITIGVFNGPNSGSLVNSTIWRNASSGLGIDPSPLLGNWSIDGVTAFGNLGGNITFGAAVISMSDFSMNAIMLCGDSTFAVTYGITWGNPTVNSFGTLISNSSLGAASGIFVAHGSADILLPTSFAGTLILRNTLLGSSTEIANVTTSFRHPRGYSTILSQKHDQTDGLNKRWEKYGIVATETTTYRTASPSIAITPNSTSNKIRATMSPRHWHCFVNSGESATVTIYVKKSASYNGNQPRLLLLSNSAVGITADVVLATASGGTGSWLTLTGTTSAVNAKGMLEFTVDCDGTAGTVYVDDFSVTGVTAKDTTAMDYWHDGSPIVMAPYSASGGGGMIGGGDLNGGFQ